MGRKDNFKFLLITATGDQWPEIPSGDPFVVYPGKDGLIDSIRWEVFAESIQDYALLQSACIPPDDTLLSGIKDYANFPRTEKWIEEALQNILDRGDPSKRP